MKNNEINNKGSKNLNSKEFVLAFRMMSEMAIRAGELDPKGKTDEEIIQAVRQFVEKLPASPNIKYQIDHRPTLLEHANKFIKNKEAGIASILLATWLEHWINNIIFLRCEILGLKHEEINNVLREVPTKAKYGWFLKIIGMKPIAVTHFTEIMKIYETRNYYVHYKWKGFDDDSPDNQLDKTNIIVNSFSKTVKYLKSYELKNELCGAGSRIKKIARSENKEYAT